MIISVEKRINVYLTEEEVKALFRVNSSVYSINDSTTTKCLKDAVYSALEEK